jgi:hypothetical protein
MKQIMLAATIPQPPPLTFICLNPRQTDVTTASAADIHIRPSKEIIYETTKREPVQKDDDYDDEFLEEDAKTFGRGNGGPAASHYIMPYVYKKRFLYRKYCIRKDGDKFKIGDTPVLVDQDGDITIKDNEFSGFRRAVGIIDT